MAFDTTKVLQAYDGGLYAAAAGSTLPANLAASLDAAFEAVGWLTEDGLGFSPNLTASDPIKGWPRGEVLLLPAATLEPTFKFTLGQHDADVLDWVVSPSREMALILEYKATATGDLHRLILPKVKVTESGEIPFNTEDMVAVELTVGASRDDTAGFTFSFQIPDGIGGTTEKKY